MLKSLLRKLTGRLEQLVPGAAPIVSGAAAEQKR
jgi:hypothetical protein